MSEYDDDEPAPAPRLPLTARPARLSLQVSGARIGSAARPVASTAPIGPLPARRFGLRVNASGILPLPKKPTDEVA